MPVTRSHLHLLLSLLFFLQHHGTHRDLHSFPTRRSSDLIDTTQLYTDDLDADELAQALARAVEVRELQEIGRDTSELQSRQYLVCRLLLEKKKLKNAARD